MIIELLLEIDELVKAMGEETNVIQILFMEKDLNRLYTTLGKTYYQSTSKLK